MKNIPPKLHTHWNSGKAVLPQWQGPAQVHLAKALAVYSMGQGQS